MATLRFKVIGERVSKKKIKKVWTSLTTKPFPYRKIRAIIIDNEQAKSLWKKLINFKGFKSIPDKDESLSDLKPLTVLDDKTMAFVTIETYPDRSKGYLIIIRKSSFVSVKENLIHELNHIINDEIGLTDGP